VGFIYDRFHTRNIADYGGLAHVMPLFAAFYMLFAMTNVGLPGTSGFVGEFMVIVAAFKANFYIALLAGLTLLLAPAYTLWMVKRVLFGTVDQAVFSDAKDLGWVEIMVFVMLAIPVLVLGFFPQILLGMTEQSVNYLLTTLVN
jgi:NADH-quinone oxidoreductase subunit M